ncbi:hypothetical protein ACJ73_02153 [Blastomyces percursus]|uniref:Uncharacterized protein n=1 Tax=Blastomyces percursus TaxID=1658174 RepID=A0A1J9QD42_9EURO|nr:hypothetical protein ACJ73_02153 [Blastomyces percursus]
MDLSKEWMTLASDNHKKEWQTTKIAASRGQNETKNLSVLRCVQGQKRKRDRHRHKQTELELEKNQTRTNRKTLYASDAPGPHAVDSGR